MPELFGIEHSLYIIISTILGSVVLLCAFFLIKKEKHKFLFLKIIAGLLFISILANRLSQVFRYDTIRWYCIIPDSFCGMTSLVLSLGVLFGKKDNVILHFGWLLGLFGGISTVIYATFVGQAPSIFYIPTISGLLHHSFSAMLVVAVLMFGYMKITYKKWYCTLFGLTCYMTLGAFLMQAFDLSDAFHIAEPLISDTPLTAWVMAPMYAVGYALVVGTIEIARKYKNIKMKKTI